MEVNSSSSEKDEETGSSRKVLMKKEKKAPMDDLNVKVPKFGDTSTRESPRISLVDKKCCLIVGNDNEHDSEANFRHGGYKRRETVTPIDIGVSLRMTSLI